MSKSGQDGKQPPTLTRFKNIPVKRSRCTHPLNTTARDTLHTTIMIQRTLLRQSRALSSSIRSTPPTSFLRLQFRPAATPASLSRISRPAAARWYSSEPDAKKDGEEVKPGEKAEAEDPAKKELEAKNKEIVELKVRCHFPCCPTQLPVSHWRPCVNSEITGQIPPLRR